MNPSFRELYLLLKIDVLRRSRNYSFLVALALSLAFSTVLIPDEAANYVTLRIGTSYVGYNNSAWVGLVNATMTTLILVVVGFYYVHGSIQQDNRLKVGNLLGAYPISNWGYLLLKTLSNGFILLLIAAVVLVGVAVKDVLLPGKYPFVLLEFLMPFLVLVVPTCLVLGAFAIALEVVLGRLIIVQQVLYFFSIQLLSLLSASAFKYDVYGLGYVGQKLTEAFRQQVEVGEGASKMSIGFLVSDSMEKGYVSLDTLPFEPDFVLSRLIWIALSLSLVFGLSFVFHRFDYRRAKVGNAQLKPKKHKKDKAAITHDVSPLRALPPFQLQPSALPLILAEAKILLRNQSFWILGLLTVGFVLQITLAPAIALNMVLPVMWFLQVNNLSSLFTKEYENGTDSYLFVAFVSARRLFLWQFLMGFFLLVLIGLPITIRFTLIGEMASAMSIPLAAGCVVALSAIFGVLTKQRRLFEILFFALVYTTIDSIPLFRYLNWEWMQPLPLVLVAMVFVALGTVAYYKRPR